MPDDNLPHSAYDPGLVQVARNTCLTLAEVLGDLMAQNMVVVGGLVPSLITKPDTAPDDVGPHPGTRDLDIGLKVAVPADLYAGVKAKLTQSDFEADVNERNQSTWHRWVHKKHRSIKVDFLIETSPGEPNPPVTKQLKGGLSAIKTDALHLAFRDYVLVALGDQPDDMTLSGARVKHTIRVCGPAALIVLKAFAHRDREIQKDKDAFDLWYVCTFFDREDLEWPPFVADRMKILLDDKVTVEALGILQTDFAQAGSIGTVKAARFLDRAGDEAFAALVVGSLQQLLGAVARK